MPNQRAKELEQQIHTETARRKHIWRKMEAAARDAIKIAKAHALSHGMTGMEWFDTPWLEKAGAAYVSYVHPAGLYKGASYGLEIQTPANLQLPPCNDDRYEGYPELTNADPAAFRKAAIQRLTANFDEYIARQNRRANNKQRQK